jgi:hypothetical protein
MPDLSLPTAFVYSVTKCQPDFTAPKIAGRVLTRCPPSSVVERVLGKNEVTGSIPVGGSEWNGPRFGRLERDSGADAGFTIRGGLAQLVRAHDS